MSSAFIPLSDVPASSCNHERSALRYLADGGEVGRWILAQDWRDNPLGALEHWAGQLHDTLRLALHSGFPHIVYWGPELHTFWNDAARHFFEGQHPHDLGRPLMEVQPDVIAKLRPLLQQVYDSGRAVVCDNIELLYQRADYVEEIHEVFSYSPILDPEGRVRGVIAPIFDATSRVLGERRMAMLADLASGTRSARTLAHYHTALADCLRRHPRDLPLVALYGMQAGTQALACCATNAPAGTWPEIFQASAGVAIADGPLAAAMRQPPRLRLLPASAVFPAGVPRLPDGPWQQPSEQVAVVPVPTPTPDRRTHWLIAALNPHKRMDADYRTFLTLVAAQIAQGLTDTVAAEQSADRALAEISRLTRTSTMGELATSIAHEINQPLTSMVLDANACRRWLELTPPNLDEARAAARRIATNGDHAGQVLAHIRNFLRRTPTPRSRVDLVQVAWSSLQLVAPQARRHDIALRFRPACASPTVHGDGIQLQQALINLLVNAVEALQSMPAGQRRTIHLEIQTPTPSTARIIVRDTGQGFAPAQSQRLFEAFQSSKPQGLGMGLSIVRSIVESHDGRIRAEGAPGRGAAFFLELPCTPPEQP